MSKRKKLVAGNWKMNGSHKSAVSLSNALLRGLNQALANTDVLICPAFVHLDSVSQNLTDTIKLGAQDISIYNNGAYTGDVSAQMLVDIGCSHVIVGHSERREYHHESSALVAEKANQAISAGLIPIVCVGETLAQRETGKTQEIIAHQLLPVIEGLSVDDFKRLVIAYEPVWAIGTGESASPEQAQAVHAFIRAQIAQHDQHVADQCQILYGGSVKPDNAKILFSQLDIDGGLIGGAALNADDFLAIIQAAETAS